MVAYAQIEDLTRQIADRFSPQAVILFGSHARGDARADSDVDLLVVLDFEGSPARKAGEILRGIRYSFPLDLMARTPAQLKERIRLGDQFMREIVEQGRFLHGSADARMG